MRIVSCLSWVSHRLIERRPNCCCNEFQILLISFRTFAGLSPTSITTFISIVLSHFLYIDHAKCFRIFQLFWISFSSFPIRFRLPYGGGTMSEAYRIISRWNMCEFIQLKKFSYLSERNKTIQKRSLQRKKLIHIEILKSWWCRMIRMWKRNGSKREVSRKSFWSSCVARLVEWIKNNEEAKKILIVKGWKDSKCFSFSFFYMCFVRCISRNFIVISIGWI